MEKNIYLIRHGQTDFNLKGIVQGGRVDTDLNDTGRAQAQLFYDNYHHIPFDKIYTSALKRSQQSVQQFIDKPLPHEALAGLNEISWGDMDGKIASDIDSHIYWNMVRSWAAGDVEAKIESGESPLEVQQRIIPTMAKIASQIEERNVLICMHGRAMRILLATVLGKDLHTMDDYEHNNLCLYLLKYENGTYNLVKGNDIAHLQC